MLIIKTALLCWQKSDSRYIRELSSRQKFGFSVVSGANAPTAESKQTGTFATELQLNYSPDGVYLDDLCYAVIMNDLNYRAMSLTASEPYSSGHTTRFETTGLI